MSTVTINNKKYECPKLGFGHMEKLESEGYDVISMFKKQQLFAPASAFIMLCVDCDREEANRLAEQHIYGGGNMQEIYQAFVKAINESDFFRRILGMDETEKKSKSSKQTEE
jgi:hypothetical protein